MNPPKRQRSSATRVTPAGQTSATGKVGTGDTDPTGRHVFFTHQSTTRSQQGRLHLECARCHTVSAVSPLQLLRARAPLFVWVPLMKYSRWARCPACAKHSWVKLHIRL